MIIPRKYVWFGELYNRDAASKKLIDEAFELAEVNQEMKKS